MSSLSEIELTQIILAIVLLLGFAHSWGYIFSRLSMPKVIGEIFGGFLLGPSVLGNFYPELYLSLFFAFQEEGKLLSLIYWLGLIFLMLVSGFEIQKSIGKSDGKIIAYLTVGSTFLPFLMGWVSVDYIDYSPYLGTADNWDAFRLIVAIAAAVTSIPVLSKIFLDIGIIDTRFAKIVLSTATLHDVILWAALAVATGMVAGGSGSISEISQTVLITIVFFLISGLVLPRLMEIACRNRWNIFIKSSAVGYIFIVCLLFAALASLLKVNIVFGALLAGIVIGVVKGQDFENEKTHIKEVSLAFFVPLYFAIVGLKINFQAGFDVLFFIGFLAYAIIFQLIGTIIAARFVVKDTLTQMNLAVAMVTKGGPGIVLASIAYELHIISESFFTILVLVAIVTSLFAGTWFRYIVSKNYPLLKYDAH